MTTALAIQKTVPTPADLRLIKQLPERVVRLLGSIQADGRLPKEMILSTEMRAWMTSAADRLSSIMKDKRPEAEVMTAGFLLSAFPRQASSDETTDMLMQAYQMAFEDAPTWAIEEAGRRWITGKCGPKHWAPSPPELRCAADEVMLITRGKIRSLRILAKIEVVTDPTVEEKTELATALLAAFAHADVGDRKKRAVSTTMDKTEEKAA